MINTLRLFYFDTTKGNSTALKILVEELGFGEALALSLTLKWRLFYRNPFKKINQHKRPTEPEKLSQRQMAPMVVLYELLLEKGYSKKYIFELLQTLGNSVATAFLKFNVPIIKHKDYIDLSSEKKLDLLKKITQRFFNAEATLSLDEKDNFSFQVNHCHFASYSNALGHPDLATLFCASDKNFFDEYQDDIIFFRSQTLATENKPCDFRFTWKQ